jgi:hypothetical protein
MSEYEAAGAAESIALTAAIRAGDEKAFSNLKERRSPHSAIVGVGIDNRVRKNFLSWFELTRAQSVWKSVT